MGIAQIVGLLAFALVSANTFAASFAMVAIGEFGEPLTECRVENFRSTPTTKDYRGRFRGLAASELPEGEYSVEISCRGARALDHVNVSNLDRFAVVSEKRRFSRNDPPPYLSVRMNRPNPQSETWWITMRALYGKRNDTVAFQGDAGEAHILDPDPGSYVVGVLSSNGYSCLHEIDLVDRTRLWTFDPAACAFQVDAFAHVVTADDKRELKTTGWYQQMRKSEEELWRALDKLKKDAAGSNSAR
jgi:hypothetical protein